MPKFGNTESRRFSIRAPLDAVVEFMTKPANFTVLFDDTEKLERIDDQTWRIVLNEKNEKGVRFHGDYTVKYVYDGKGLMTWDTIGKGNMSSKGRARFTSTGPSSTEVDWTETIECEMDVNFILAKVIKPIVDREIAKGIGSFLDRSKERLEK